MTFFQGTHLTKMFGGLCALNDVNFDLKSGEIVGIIGPNGAGKTTLINLLSGFTAPDKGKVVFLDRDITGMRPHLVNKFGISRTFQIMKTFPKLTVLDNVTSALVDRKNRTCFWTSPRLFQRTCKTTKRRGRRRESCRSIHGARSRRPARRSSRTAIW